MELGTAGATLPQVETTLPMLREGKQKDRSQTGNGV